MKMSCTQENLNKGLSIVSRMATTRATLPILANILISSDKGRLKLAATDLEIGITTWIGAKIEEEGGITIPARTFSDFVSANNDDAIGLEVKDTTLHLSSGHYNANIKGLEASEYPVIPEISEPLVCEIPALQLKEAIVKTVFAASTDESRPVLGGVSFRISEKEVRLVATDSYRLAEMVLKDVKIGQVVDNVVIPTRTISELARILQNADEMVKVYLNENQILFSFGHTQLISRLIEGNFPAYEQLIPKSCQTKAIVNAAELASALKMSSLFAKESAYNVKLRLEKGVLELVAVSPQVGDNTSKIPAETEGNSLEIAFNSRYILDALNVINTEKVILELNDINERKPSILRPQDNGNYLYIIMPLDIHKN